MWSRFLKKKFSETDAEKRRQKMEDIPRYRAPGSHVTWKEFSKSVACMPNHKAVGPDGIPSEAIKYCPAVKKALFKIIVNIWEQERLPNDFAQAKFTMLFKNKGSDNDPSKYRCIALLNHAYKILSRIIMLRLVSKSELHLADWQAGFRPGRGCRDNTFILRTLCQRMLQLGRAVTLTFVDYSAAFDTVSHKFLDRALKKAGATNKVRAMFRAVYNSATAYTTAPDVDGKNVKSDIFPIKRGVVQGDITSPLYFILALDLILRIHDQRVDKGVTIDQTIVHTLGYADDTDLVVDGDSIGVGIVTHTQHSVTHCYLH